MIDSICRFDTKGKKEPLNNVLYNPLYNESLRELTSNIGDFSLSADSHRATISHEKVLSKPSQTINKNSLDKQENIDNVEPQPLKEHKLNETTQITNTTINPYFNKSRVTPNKFPYTAICSLRIKSQSGREYLGTCFFVAPRILLTAGHCVFLHADKGWADTIEIIPALNINDKPFGSVTSQTFYSLRGWTEKKYFSHDFGVIILPSDSDIGFRTGWFGCINYKNLDAYDREILNISSYPGSQGGVQQWTMDGRGEANTFNIKHTFKTSGGESGAPIWVVIDNRNYVVGLHTSSSSSNISFSTRINKHILEQISHLSLQYSK